MSEEEKEEQAAQTSAPEAKKKSLYPYQEGKGRPPLTLYLNW